MLKKYQNSYLSYFLMYNFYYLSWALFSALISVYLMDKGYKASEVSLVVSISYFTSLIAQPFIGSLNDKYDMKKVNAILFLLASIGGVIFLFANNLLMTIIGYSFVLTLINGSNPVMEKIATASPYPYGKIRIWETIGYALGSQLGGLLYDYIAPEAIYITFILTMLLCIVGLLGTKPNFQNQDSSRNKPKTKTMDLFKNTKYLHYLLISGLFYGITNVGHTYISSMFVSDGLDVKFVSTILSVAVLCEAPLVFFSNRFMDKISNKTLLVVAYLMVLGQMACYAFDVATPLKIAVTLLTKHPAGMLFIMINLKVINTLIDDSQQITALAFVQTFRNLCSIVTQNMAGTILDTSSYEHLFLICLLTLLIGFMLVLTLKIKSGNDKKLFE